MSPVVLILLAGLAIGAIALVAIMISRKPKSRPEPWEKAEIMKQLLALSELEANAAKVKAPVRPRTPPPKQGEASGSCVFESAFKTFAAGAVQSPLILNRAGEVLPAPVNPRIVPTSHSV